jgi:hypothetical protein
LSCRRAVGHFDFDVMRVEEAAVAAHDCRPCALGHAGEAAGQLADDLVLVRAQLVEVDRRRGEGDAAIGHVLRFVHHGGDVQQRLRRNAADVQADAAERRVALDDDRLHAEVGAAEGRRIAAGAGTEDEHFAFEVGAAADRWRLRGAAGAALAAPAQGRSRPRRRLAAVPGAARLRSATTTALRRPCRRA